MNDTKWKQVSKDEFWRFLEPYPQELINREDGEVLNHSYYYIFEGEKIAYQEWGMFGNDIEFKIKQQ